MLTDEQQTVIGSMNSKREETPKEDSAKEEAPKDWAAFADGMKFFYKSITFTD